MRSLLTSVALAALLLAGRTAWNLFVADPAPAEAALDPAAEAAETDSWIEGSLGGGTAAPARGWLSARGNVLFEGDPEEAAQLVETLSRAGAERVWFVDIERIGATNVSGAIAVELPRDPDARARLLRAESEFGQTEPRPDVGQRFAAFSFD